MGPSDRLRTSGVGTTARCARQRPLDAHHLRRRGKVPSRAVRRQELTSYPHFASRRKIFLEGALELREGNFSASTALLRAPLENLSRPVVGSRLTCMLASVQSATQGFNRLIDWWRVARPRRPARFSNSLISPRGSRARDALCASRHERTLRSRCARWSA